MRLTLITLLALAAVSCRAQTPTVDQKSSATTHAGPTIALSGKSLTFNGASLVLGADLLSWEKVLGASGVCDGDEGISWSPLRCWNGLGLSVGTERVNNRKLIKTFHIFLNQRPKPEGYDLLTREDDGTPMALLDIYHKHIFTGRLELDGADVNSTSTVLDVIKQNDYSYNCLAELRDCWVGTDDPYYETGFSTDSRLQKGMIYEFEVSVRER